MSDEIPYGSLVERALREVVIREALRIAGGAPGLAAGKNHFYIGFKTKALGVDMPESLREQYPDEMTIVLRNRFWDLVVGDDYFSVGLSFGGVPATLRIPLGAITRFHDPHADFELRLTPTAETTEAIRVIAPVEAVEPEVSEEPEGPEEAPEAAEEESSTADVVSLDQFRRK
ncbi:MAG: ClpXP protease specificity-enhancing factor SspB [Deltaproteobacteria bacterium]|jgi:hypothetical protein